jgi:hypothetical protein
MEPGDDRATIGFAVPTGLSALTVRYDLHAEIGRGGMGIVYKAHDRQTGDLVAIKVIHPSIASDPQLIERFKNELILARRITHRNVCRVYDLNDFAGIAVISMEFVAGRSLRDLLNEAGSLSIRHGVKIVRQIIAGLGEAHAQGVVHRDLKPENILIDRNSLVKVMDFGIARLADSRLTATGFLVGTPAYMSPEQAEGKAADARSDIYALGLVIYEMFCGQPAFAGETPVAVVAKQVHERPTAPREIEPDLPVRIERAVLTCLEKDPRKRFQSVAELEAALSATSVAAPDDFEDAGAPLPVHLVRWRKSDWGLVAAAVVGLAMFFVCFARTSLAPRSQVTFDRTVLKRIAEEHLQRLGVPATGVTQGGVNLNPAAYIYLARQYGASLAREVANNPVHYWTWEVDFGAGSLTVDHKGRLTSFSRQPVPVDPAVSSFEDAQRQAARTVGTFFGQTASTLEVERETRGQVYGFTWFGPKAAHGLRERFSVSIDSLGASSLTVEPDLPAGYAAVWFNEVTMDRWGLPVAVVICVLVSAFGFFNRRRVVLAAPWRTALAVISFIGGAGFSFASFDMKVVGTAVSVAVALGLGLLYAVVSLLASIALEVLMRKADVHKLGTLSSVFKWRAGKEAAGLSVVRGVFIGLALLGADACAIWLGTTYFQARLSPVHVGLLGGIISGIAWPAALVFAIGAAQVAGIGLLVAFTDSIASRLPGRKSIGLISAAALLAASGIRLSMGAVQPWYWTLLVLFIDYLFLVLAFRRFDLLTLCVAVGTFALWWANYPLFVMQQPIGASAPWTVFILWGLGVAAASAAAFQSTFRRGYRRLAAAFD